MTPGTGSSLASEDWRPSAAVERLRARAMLLAMIRRFFAERDVLEVETPVLAASAASDVHIASFETRSRAPASSTTPRLYLQSSPEFAMKRLLAAGSGPIYQIGKAFRDGEHGRVHNPEFTLLEWYRPGFDHHRLMDELDALLDEIPGVGPPRRRVTYREAFVEHAGIDPFDAPLAELETLCRRLGCASVEGGDRDTCLELVFSHALQPALGAGRTYVYDFPASQAALARVRPGPPDVAERFELFLDGIEIANGYHELGDAVEQRERFESDRRTRRAMGLPDVPVDERLLRALEHGLPDCAGVAVGLDRLCMIIAGAQRLDEVMAFPTTRA